MGLWKWLGLDWQRRELLSERKAKRLGWGAVIVALMTGAAGIYKTHQRVAAE